MKKYLRPQSVALLALAFGVAVTLAAWFLIKRPGERSEYWVIKLIEPYEGNEGALGIDVLMRPEARAAAERARDTAEPSITAPFLLQQQHPGMILYLPLYGENVPRQVAE